MKKMRYAIPLIIACAAPAPQVKIVSAPMKSVAVAASDVNGDGVIDGLDLGIIKDHLYQPVTDETQSCDVNSDGVIDGVDMSIVKASLGQPTVIYYPVPELTDPITGGVATVLVRVGDRAYVCPPTTEIPVARGWVGKVQIYYDAPLWDGAGCPDPMPEGKTCWRHMGIERSGVLNPLTMEPLDDLRIGYFRESMQRDPANWWIVVPAMSQGWQWRIDFDIEADDWEAQP